jgi:pimeloyl-ACP methyl ester carboxylesterase
MGGYVALAFARRHPGRLRALILADTRAEPDSPESKAARERTIAFTRTHTTLDVLETMMPRLLGNQTRAQRPDVVNEVRQIARAQSPAAVIAALQAMRDRSDASPALREIAVPTLVVVGALDVVTPPDTASSLAAAIPGARLEVIEGAGHLSNLEQPEPFTEAVRAFLQTHV